MVVYLAVQKKQSGASMEEVAAYVNGLLPNLCHWFTVDDLVYLKRGGRVSAATALLGGILNIKPILHVDDEGHLISMSKVRGRRQSIQAVRIIAPQHRSSSASTETRHNLRAIRCPSS